MPVLFNTDSGYAENVSSELAQQAIKAGTHEIPIVSPDGELGSVPFEQASAALEQGFRQPNTNELKSSLEHAQFSTPTEQAKTALEGAASSATLGLSSLAANAIFDNEKEQNARAKANPNARLAGEVAGLGASALTGIGAIPAMEMAGAKVAATIAGKSVISRIGSQAAKLAAESAVQQFGSEVDKNFWQNPEAVQNAAVNVGLAGLLGGVTGGALGSVKEMWKLTAGKKLQQQLEKFKPVDGDSMIVEAPGEMIRVKDPFTSESRMVQQQPVLEEIAKKRIDPFTKEALQDINSREFVEAVAGKKINDVLWKEITGLAGGAAGWLMGDGGISGFVAGQIGHYLGKKAPESIRLGLLKFIGSEAITSSAGFKAAIDVADAFLKGEAKLNKAVSNIFDVTAPVLISNVSEKEQNKLQERIDIFANNPELAMDIAGDAGAYMPDQAAAMAMTSAKAVMYLESIKPRAQEMGLMENSVKPSKVAQANYSRALQIANNPAIVLSNIKAGDLTQNDIQHLAAMYPEVLRNMQQKLQAQLIEVKHAETEIPYKTQLALSMFLGQPLTASLAPNSITANQLTFQVPPSAQMMPKPNNKSVKVGALKDISKQSMTGAQAREMHRRK